MPCEVVDTYSINRTWSASELGSMLSRASWPIGHGDENTIVDSFESFNHLKVGLLDDLHPNLMYRIFAPNSGAKTLEFCSGLQLDGDD